MSMGKTISVENFKLPLYNEIPDVGLYLDQVTKYIAKYIEPLECISITSSMISNYVKKKIITNPIKKQYYREQIAELFFIVLAKSVISLEDVSTMLHIYRSKYKTEQAYKYFAEVMSESLCIDKDQQIVSTECSHIDMDNETAFEQKLLRNIIMAVAYKVYLEKTFQSLRKN